MRSATCFALLSFLFLFSLVNHVESRKDPAGEYWREVMKDQTMPEEIQLLIQSNSVNETERKATKSQVDHKCEEGRKPLAATNTEITVEKKLPMKDMEPMSRFTTHKNSVTDAEPKKNFVDDFEPRPNVSAYNEDEVGSKLGRKVSGNGDFEPRPNVSAYGEDKVRSKLGGKVTGNGDFEPRPNVSAYNDDKVDFKLGGKVSATGDFEPRPNVSAYNEDKVGSKERKVATGDFEPRPSATAYGDE